MPLLTMQVFNTNPSLVPNITSVEPVEDANGDGAAQLKLLRVVSTLLARLPFPLASTRNNLGCKGGPLGCKDLVGGGTSFIFTATRSVKGEAAVRGHHWAVQSVVVESPAPSDRADGFSVLWRGEPEVDIGSSD
jgi:hypothetical protein